MSCLDEPNILLYYIDVNIKIEDESEIETPEIDNQKLTADEIKQISDQLQKLQAEGN